MMKDIPGYEGKYQINENGVVINSNGHPLRTAVSNSGYLRVCLEPVDGVSVDSLSKNKSIHRLVAETFIPNPNNLPVVMHIDNDKLNNHVGNLKWGTQSENIQQAFDEGRKKSPIKLRMTRPVDNRASSYVVYNEDTQNKIVCRTRSEVADLIGYSEMSLKNMIGRDRCITLGEYKGYKIRREDFRESPFHKFCI